MDDPRVASYRDLPRSRTLREASRFVIDGRFLLERMVEYELDIESILTDESHIELAMQCAGSATEVFVAESSILNELVGFRFHRGLLACGKRPQPTTLEQAMANSARRSTLAICDRIADQENLGGVIRNAVAFGANAIIGPGSADPFSRRVLRVSMGASLRRRPILSDDLEATVRILRQHDYRIIAAVLDPDATDLSDCEPADRVAIVLGNEGFGLDERWNALCDERIAIAMAAGIDSLNVASAAAVFLHHFRPSRYG